MGEVEVGRIKTSMRATLVRSAPEPNPMTQLLPPATGMLSMKLPPAPVRRVPLPPWTYRLKFVAAQSEMTG